MIGGQEQREGAAHAARDVECTPDGLSLDLAETYDKSAGVRRLKRCFTLHRDGLLLTDEGELETAQPVTWVFLLRSRPEWIPGQVTAGRLILSVPEVLSFTAEEIPVTDARMARNWPGSLWRVRLRSEAKDHFRAEFVFSAKDREA